MRSVLLFVGFVTLFSNSFWAQEVIMNDEVVQFSSGSHDAIVAVIPFASREVIEKQLKSELKGWGGKLVISGEEYKVVQENLKKA